MKEKAKETLVAVYFQYWRFLSLKRCNLAAFKLQLTLALMLRDLPSRKKDKENPQ
ncbi:hypothetical protein [Wolbachia pipientis]|uniref:hypothetical protein n=1 Tax=Wolbachia pipientis TaxID=955 RepID=UPI0025A4A759|nr:hypothetical protein [Wolbachia pipientis]MDM8335140.1 hypothetical protein [Wolbachia pipientis]